MEKVIEPIDPENLLADLSSHHIEGYAYAALEAGRDGRFSVPLVSHIEDTLYVGGCIDGVKLHDDFSFVVSLYPWERYELGPDTARIEVPMQDAGELPEIQQLIDTANLVRLLVANGHKTLVHCQAGLNRSNLVAGLALILGGMEPSEAIQLLRDKRCDTCLCNETFEAFLLGFGRDNRQVA